ncbi:GNAT family N-acetyltransferase [Roseospira visakhapatnamensis]|uniref:GNAT superfamily N-acetyltransferase n=1 Tax=Roseospira visakhapatnamensis TaxID=390880 RepID=A0A7W6RE37_9PROT|nr:GNAT family N-acetyltransferase [Roseospira visakhapatnamensis]MBB4266861.1 GNAT superfamily N-acetyltransferase [Roseospira visakhapatnamensis]
MIARPDHPAPLVRMAAAGDWPQWRALWRGYCEFYDVAVADDVTAETWRRCLDTTLPALRCLVAESRPVGGDRGRVVGFATLLEHPGTWSIAPVGYLEDLFVHPEARRRGVAGALLHACAAFGRQAGWVKLYWRTGASNTAAQALYDRVGVRTDWVVYDWVLDRR